ncbi:uncharacterized protein LOC112169873 isoform X4 [Rosa chinensis]|uniref:uncharacterized protein LOC112169873 isoform X4 n=1 Tax=Rosa chinensis TaxID=74649 RepID=UPI000D08CC54|nr:uncharacterized protein LOC112169873 isoform X4 [Rosa chinensis]
MGLLGLVGFALQCFDVVAWPLFALVYPLYSSIRAIETNSITDTHKINTYWVVFSLILLFEHAFMKLLEWFLLWPYIRLLIVFFLVMPHFDGALYVYKHLICPCLSMDPQIVINLFNKRKESFVRDNFLSEVERYVKENGPEGLERFIACKSTRTNLDVKEFNAVSSMDTEASKSIKPNGGQNDIKAVQVMAKKKRTTASQVSQAKPNLTVNEDKFSSTKMNEKAIEGAADGEILKTPPPKKFQKEWTTTQTDATLSSPLGDNKDKATYEALKIKNEADPKLTWPGNRAAMEIYEKPVEVGTGIEDPVTPKEVQKEWTCALCQVTTTCESNLNSHLQGRKHKAAYEAVKARNQEFLPKIAPASTAKTSNQPNEVPGKSSPSSGSKQKVTINENSKSIEANGGQNDIKAMQVCQAEPNLTVNEDKFSSMKMNEKAILGAALRDILKTPPPKKVQKEWTTTQTDATLSSPLGDNKGKATYEALKIKNEADPKLTWPENRAAAAMEIYEKPVEDGTGIEDPETPKEVQKEWTCALCQVTTTCESNLNYHLQGRKHKAAYEALKVRNQEFLPKIAPASTAKTSNQPNEVPGKSSLSCGSKQKVTINENSTRINLNVQELNAVSFVDNEALKSIEANGGQNDIKAVQITAKKKETTSSQVCQAEPNLTLNEDKFYSTKMNEKAIEGAADREILKTSPPKKVQKEWTTTQTDATLIPPLGDNKDKATYEAQKIKNEADPKLSWPENRAAAAMEIYEKPVEVGTGIEDSETLKEVQKEWTCALCQVTTTCESNLNSHLQGRKHKAAYEAVKASNQEFLPKIAPASTAKTSNQPNEVPGKSSPSSGSKQKVTINENSTRINLNVKELNAVSFMDNEASKSIEANGGQNDIKAVQVTAKKKETTSSQVCQVEPNLTVNEDKFSSMKMNEKAIEGAADGEILKTPPPKKVQKEWTTVSPLQTQTDATLSSPPGDNKDKATYEALKIKNEAGAKLTWTENRAVVAMEIYEKPVEVGTGIEDRKTPEEVQKEWTCTLCQVTTTCENNLNSHLQGQKHKAAYEAVKARNQEFLPKIAPASTAKTSNQPNAVPGKSSPSSGSEQKVTIIENSKSIEANGGQNDIKAMQVTAKKKEAISSQVCQAEPNLAVNEDKFSSTKMNEKAIGGAAYREILKTPPPKKVQKEWTTVSPLQTQIDATLSSPPGDNKDKATYKALKIKNEAEAKLTWTENRAVAAMEIYEKPVEVGTGIEHPKTPKEVQKEWTCTLCQVTTTCENNLKSHLQGRKHKAAYEAVKASNQEFLPKIAPASTAKTSNPPNQVPGKSSPSSGSKQKVTINENSKSIEANGGRNDIKAVQVTAKRKETTASQVSQAEPNLTVNEDKFSSRKMNEKVIEVAADREILKTSPPKKVQKEWTSVNPLQTQTDATLTSLLGDNKHEGTYEALKIKNEAELTGPENRTVAAMEINEKLVEVGTGIEDPESPKEVQKEWTCALCQVTTTCERNLNSHLRGRKHKAAYEALKGNQAFVPNIAPASTAKTSNQPNKEPGKSIPKKMEMKMKMKMCKARKIVVQLQSHRSNPAMARKGSKQKVTLNENVQGQKNSSPAPITKKQSSNGQKGKIAIQVEKVQSQQPKPNEVPRVKSSPLWCAICRIRCAGEIDMLSHLNGRKHKENVQERKKRT